jgi:uncharacterized protein YjdB
MMASDAAPSKFAQMSSGTARQFRAVITYTDGSTVGTYGAGLIWSSTDPTVAIVSNDAATTGLVSAVMPGTTQIVATQGDLSGQIDLIISP